jgi:hypothetical protein
MRNSVLVNSVVMQVSITAEALVLTFDRDDFKPIFLPLQKDNCPLVNQVIPRLLTVTS